MTHRAMTGYEYGNARLRARWSRLLTPTDYSAMAAAPDLDHLMGRLAGSDYGADVEVAAPGFAGLRMVDEIVRRHLTRQLRDIRSFYGDETPSAVDPLVDRWDVRNLVTVFRGHVARLAPQEVAALIVPAGRLDEPMLLELAAQPGLRAAVDLMVAWSVPSRRVARALATGLADYERSGDPGTLEAFLYTFEPVSEAAPEVAAALAGEVDERNLVIALRMRRARLDGEELREVSWLSGGRLRPGAFERIIFADEPATAVGLIRDSIGRPAWVDRVASWDDPSGLEAALRKARWRHEMDGYHHGDPLGAAIPVGFVAAKQAEGHDIRLLAGMIVHELAADEVLERLVMT